MQQHTKISEYLTTVCDQIRWKRAHDVLAEELENHIIDQKNAFIERGMDEQTAIDKAIQEMGDPVLIGCELDNAHRPKTEWSIIILTAVIILIGVILRTFITHDSGVPSKLGSEIFNIAAGIGCMIVVYFLDFTFIIRNTKKIYAIIVAAMLILVFTAPTVNGRTPYVQFVELLIPVVLVGIIYSMRAAGYFGIVICGLALVPPVFLGIMSRGLTSVVIVLVSSIALITMAVLKEWFNVKKLKGILFLYIVTAATAAVSFFVFFFNNAYRISRLKAFINPFRDAQSVGYMELLIRKLVTGAKFFGTGDAAISKGARLPEIDTNLLVAYIIHRLGWISFILLLILLSVFIARALIICQKQRSVLGKLMSLSVLTTFALQVVLYIMSNLGFEMFSPLTFPFISYSGSSVVVNMILIGIMLSVVRSGDIVSDNMRQKNAGRKKLFEVIDGKLIIDLNLK